MTVAPRIPPAPVGQQAPPTRAAARLGGALRVTRGSFLLTTGTASRRHQPHEDRILRQDAGSWHAGYRAGRSGAPLTLAPCRADTTETWSWTSGYIEGKAARLNRVETATIKLDANREY